MYKILKRKENMTVIFRQSLKRIFMKNKKKNDDISVYLEDREYIANTYVLRCYSVTILLYFITLVLNVLNVFIVDHNLMFYGFIPSLAIYIIVRLVAPKMSLSNEKTKYFILFCVITTFSIMGIFITYHVTIVMTLPFLFATLYSSKQIMRYVYVLTVISTFAVVYGGYFFGLCDANMVLLTNTTLDNYIVNNHFALTEINNNPYLTLGLYYAMPRCLICISFMSICNGIFNIVSGSLEKARLTDELEKAKIEAENANRAKTQFLARISHEIRTPINAVMGMNEMILRESTEENVCHYAEDVKTSSVMLLSIINEILDSSKIESGMMEIVPVNYQLNIMLNDLYNMINLKVQEKPISLEFDIDESIPAEYFGDDKRIKQVLLNLLTNAVKYSDKGKITLKLRCKTDGEKAILSYSVKDTGIGIKEEDLGKIYDEFQRIDMSRNRNVEGTGLGMNIVQKLLKLMNSELKIQSTYGVGSEFSFDIEQKIINNKPLGNFRKKDIQHSEETKSRKKYTMSDAKILVVDDNLLNLKVFKALLKDTEMQITEVDGGRKCLEILEKQSFDLIFLDHMMPDMDGIETLHEIKKRKLCEEVPVIMLTANAIVGDREKYINEGFDDFLSKPIMPDVLDKIILDYLSEKFSDSNNQESISHKIPEIELNSENCKYIFRNLRKNLNEINFASGVRNCNSDVEFYIEIFKFFVNLPMKTELEELYNQNDYKNYSIKVHGFKNNAYSIGADEMGDICLKHEKLTKESFPQEVEELQKQLFEKYDRICSVYADIIKSYT